MGHDKLGFDSRLQLPSMGRNVKQADRTLLCLMGFFKAFIVRNTNKLTIQISFHSSCLMASAAIV